jgi:uncharacterized membrane protein
MPRNRAMHKMHNIFFPFPLLRELCRLGITEQTNFIATFTLINASIMRPYKVLALYFASIKYLMSLINTSSLLTDESRINWTAMGMILALISNMGAGVWYASNLSSRVQRLEEKTLSLHRDRELLVRIDERMHSMAEDMTEVKRHIINPSSRHFKGIP